MGHFVHSILHLMMTLLTQGAIYHTSHLITDHTLAAVFHIFPTIYLSYHHYIIIIIIIIEFIFYNDSIIRYDIVRWHKTNILN